MLKIGWEEIPQEHIFAFDLDQPIRRRYEWFIVRIWRYGIVFAVRWSERDAH